MIIKHIISQNVADIVNTDKLSEYFIYKKNSYQKPNMKENAKTKLEDSGDMYHEYMIGQYVD